jgi:hypothetical protein
MGQGMQPSFQNAGFEHRNGKWSMGINWIGHTSTPRPVLYSLVLQFTFIFVPLSCLIVSPTGSPFALLELRIIRNSKSVRLRK